MVVRRLDCWRLPSRELSASCFDRTRRANFQPRSYALALQQSSLGNWKANEDNRSVSAALLSATFASSWTTQESSPTRGPFAREPAPWSFTLPVLSPGDRRAALRSLWSPFLSDARWEAEHTARAGSAHVYLDVSGSMSGKCRTSSRCSAD